MSANCVMSASNRSESGYERPHAVPYFVDIVTSGLFVHTTRCSALRDAYARDTRPPRHDDIHERSPGPLYQLVSMPTGVCATSCVARAWSASGPMPNSSWGVDAVVVVVVAGGVVEVGGVVGLGVLGARTGMQAATAAATTTVAITNLARDIVVLREPGADLTFRCRKHRANP